MRAGFCPEPLCACDETGELELLPDESDRNISNIIAFDERNVDLNRVCKFACKYGYCPEKLRFDKPKENQPAAEDDPNPRDDIVRECFIYQASSEGRNDHRCQLLCNNPDTLYGTDKLLHIHVYIQSGARGCRKLDSCGKD